MLYPENDPCPCQSGRTANNCCFRPNPPLVEEGARFTSLDVESKLVDDRGAIWKLPPNLKLGVVFRQPYQQEPEVEAIADSFIRAHPIDPDLSEHELVELLNPFAHRVSHFVDSLYSVRHHQRQFLFRLGKVFAQQAFAFSPPRSKTELRLEDRPLRAELEAFLIRVAGSLDALSWVVCMLLHRNPKEHGKFARLGKLLVEDSNLRQGKGADLRSVLAHHRRWTAEARDLRNKIVHEGEFDVFSGVGHRQLLLLDASIGGVPAGGFTVRVWRDLLALSRDVVGCLEAHRFT